MRQLFITPSVNDWTSYYDLQIGGSLPGFHGTPYQRGRGIGSFFRGLFRMALPVLTKFGKIAGRQALKSGAAVASDLLAGEKFSESLKQRGKEGLGNILQESSEAVLKGKGLGNRHKKLINGVYVIPNDIFSKHDTVNSRKKRASHKK